MFKLPHQLCRSSLNTKCILFAASNIKPVSAKVQPLSSLARLTSKQPVELNEAQIKTVDRLYDGLIKSNRASLAQAITLIESTNQLKHMQAKLLLSKALNCWKQTLADHGPSSCSFRIGISLFQSWLSLKLRVNFYRTIWTTWCWEIHFLRKYGNLPHCKRR